MLHNIMDRRRGKYGRIILFFLTNSTCAQVRHDCVVTHKTFSDWLNYGGRVAAEVTRLEADIHSTTIPSAHTKRGG